MQTNLLLPLVKLDDEEKKILNINNDDYYVDYRHLDRCIELLNDLKRGTISMTLLPSSNIDSQQQQQQTGLIKSQLAGIYLISISTNMKCLLNYYAISLSLT